MSLSRVIFSAIELRLLREAVAHMLEGQALSTQDRVILGMMGTKLGEMHRRKLKLPCVPRLLGSNLRP